MAALLPALGIQVIEACQSGDDSDAILAYLAFANRKGRRWFMGMLPADLAGCCRLYGGRCVDFPTSCIEKILAELQRHAYPDVTCLRRRDIKHRACYVAFDVRSRLCRDLNDLRRWLCQKRLA